ncbi:hypothetical protein HGO21_18355 [Acinetobacter sp. CUI P1]|nr:hypothetical protein [Acinetobacter sp. CUI P1]
MTKRTVFQLFGQFGVFLSKQLHLSPIAWLNGLNANKVVSIKPFEAFSDNLPRR